jgi:hypothetical protein
MSYLKIRSGTCSKCGFDGLPPKYVRGIRPSLEFRCPCGFTWQEPTNDSVNR